MKQADGQSLQSPLRVSVLYLLLTHYSRGDSQVIGPRQSIVAGVGDDVILPCYLKPATDVTKETIEWRRSDLELGLIHVWRAGQDLEYVKNPSYRGRTSLFTDELKRGNFSLKLSNVQLTDQATYECDIPLQSKNSSVQLVVASGVVSSPVISLLGIDRNRGGVSLNCESAGWYPEPEVLWLDGEGNLLSAGPTETVRGPDDLYTVSSRVTVEKRHSNSFTCRVQQKDTNHTRETHITVPDDFFDVESNCSAPTRLAVVSAVFILVFLLLGFSVWKLRDNKIKTKRSHLDEDQVVEMKTLKGKGAKRSRCLPMVSRQKLLEEQQRREEAENRIQTLQEELQTKISQLQEEQRRREKAETEVQEKNEELQDTAVEPLEEEEENNDRSSMRTEDQHMIEALQLKKSCLVS